MTESKVVGRRLGFWHGTSPLMLAFIFVVCPLCVILAVRFFLGLRHVDNLFDHFGEYLVPSALAVVGLIMGPVALVTVAAARRAYVVVSACPACGFEAPRNFRDARDKNVWPVACGHCLAYLRVHPTKLVVREQALNTETDHISHYGVVKDQYASVVSRRDDEDRQFAFVMPAMCAMCCAPEAPFRNEIGVASGLADWGITSTLFWRSFNNPVRKMNAPVAPDEYGRAVKHVQAPACATHKEQTAIEGNESGTLYFVNYRYYKEFCALNHITVGPEVAREKAETGIPHAVARVAPAKDDDTNDRSASSGA